MKFLFFGDKHERVSTPENRIGDYQEEIRLKTQEIIDIGKRNKVTAFLQPGDFWDTPNPPLDYASKVMKRWTNIDLFGSLDKLVTGNEDEIREVANSFKKDYIPMVGVVGNHELFGNNIKTLPKTMAGFINKLGLTKFATKENPVFFTTEDGLKIAITGTHYHIDIDSPEHIDDYIVKEKLGDYHIHIVHGMLSDKDMGKYIRHTLLDKIRHTKADITLTGHDHIGFPITEIDGKYFANPGAIPRLSNDLKEIKREPKVILIDISKKDGMKLTEVPLTSAKKGELVLDRKKITEKKAKEEKLEEFKKAVRNADMKKTADITEIVRDIADNKKLPKEVKDSVIKRLSEKIEKMNPNSEVEVENTYATKIVLENFQSHEYTELDLSEGFNVLVGESKQGKSSVLRAFNLVYENKPRGKRYIRKGADYARIIVYLSNGYIIERFVEDKKGGKNGYFITDPKTGEREFHNTKILPEVQKLLGFTTLNIDKDLDINLNFLKQGTGWFLIGDHISAPNKAKIIGGIYGTQYADAVTRDLEKEERKFKDKSKLLNEQLEKTDKQIEGFEYLKDLKLTIDDVDRLLKEVKELEIIKTEITLLLEKREEIKKKSEENNNLLLAFKDLDKTYEILLDVKSDERKLIDLEGLLIKHQDMSSKLNNIHLALEQVKNIDGAYPLVSEVKKQVYTKETLEQCILKREKIVESISNQLEIISLTDKLKEAKKTLNETNLNFERRTKVEKSILERDKVAKLIKEQIEIIEDTKLIENAKELYKDILLEENKKKQLKERIERAEDLEGKSNKIKKSLKAITLTIDSTEKIEYARSVLEKIKKVQEKRANISQKLEQRELVGTQIKSELITIKESEEKTKEDIEKYKELLAQVGKCPICLGTIDKATVNRIVAEYTKN